MAEIVNLRLARKAKKSDEEEGQAAANRSKHGQAKGDRLRQAKEAARQARELEGHLRDDDFRNEWRARSRSCQGQFAGMQDHPWRLPRKRRPRADPREISIVRLRHRRRLV